MKSKASSADALRAVPPRDFVGARNALAAQLAKRGKAAEARQVARLRRPSPVVWALNRAAAARRRELGTLGTAVDRLRRAQLGEGDVRAAVERYRTAFEPLVRGANQVLREAGVGVPAALDRRIRSTLLAAVTDRGLRADLEAGRLADEHEDPGFAVLARGPIPAAFLRDRPRPKRSAPPAEAVPTPPADAAKARRLTREQGREAARDERSRARQAQRAERAAQAVERRAAAVREALTTLERRSGELRAAADEARKARVTPRAASPARVLPPVDRR